MNILQDVLGGGQQQQDFQDFINRYQQGQPSEGYSDQEVANRYQQVASKLPAQDYERAAVQAFERLSPQQREQFGQFLSQQAQQRGINIPGLSGGNGSQDAGQLARATAQVHQQQPDLLQSLFSQGGALSNPVAKAAVAGIVAMAAKHFLSGK